MEVTFLDIENPSIEEFDWVGVEKKKVSRYWSGDMAEESRHFEFQLAWNTNSMLVRFTARRNSDCRLVATPVLDNKTLGLWDYDVFEIFVSPDSRNRQRYFEFEISPQGEWLDAQITIGVNGRNADFNFISDMSCKTSHVGGIDIMMMEIPWTGFGGRPETNDVWTGNIFRCTGSGDSRGYLAHNPTLTERPDFHVPNAFVPMTFVI